MRDHPGPTYLAPTTDVGLSCDHSHTGGATRRAGRAGRRRAPAAAARAAGGRGLADRPPPAPPRAAPAARAGVEPRRRRPVLRVVVTWLTAAATLMLLSAVLSSVDVDSFAAALGSAALIGLINAFVWPVVIRLALPITVLTLGLGVLALNGAVVLAVAAIDTGLHVSGLA